MGNWISLNLNKTKKNYIMITMEDLLKIYNNNVDFLQNKNGYKFEPLGVNFTYRLLEKHIFMVDEDLFPIFGDISNIFVLKYSKDELDNCVMFFEEENIKNYVDQFNLDNVDKITMYDIHQQNILDKIKSN